MAGSVTSGDDPGFPVTISQSGVYRLTGNLSVPDNNTTAILITASSVTVDLNGFSIMGPVSCSQDPVVCPEPGKGIGIKSAAQPVQSVKVMNGTVRGMGSDGIQLSSLRSSVDGVTAESNSGSGISVTGTVTASSALRNGQTGIIASEVRNSGAGSNVQTGILLFGGGVADNNVAGGNGENGIFAPFASIVTNNRLLLNKGAAIWVICPSVVTGNSILNDGTSSVETHDAGCVLNNNAMRP